MTIPESGLDVERADETDRPRTELVDPSALPWPAARVLENCRRRAVVRVLLDAREPVELCTLVGRVASVECDVTVASTIMQQRQRVHVSLCRTHLPLLEEYDLVEYDRENGIVGPTTRLSAIEPYLDTGAIAAATDRPAGDG